jgi:hypothetical protein
MRCEHTKIALTYINRYPKGINCDLRFGLKVYTEHNTNTTESIPPCEIEICDLRSNCVAILIESKILDRLLDVPTTILLHSLATEISGIDDSSYLHSVSPEIESSEDCRLGGAKYEPKIASTPILPIFLLPIIQILAIDHSESIDELVLVNDCLLENPDYKCENLRQ